jgi:hypothetical protein
MGGISISSGPSCIVTSFCFVFCLAGLVEPFVPLFGTVGSRSRVLAYG